MTELERATERIAFARGYTLRFLDGLTPDDWFRIPPAGVSHIAWQAGHVAYAEYRLVLVRLRGVAPDDAGLMPDELARHFKAESTPDPDPSAYPPADAIRAALDRVHARALKELSATDPATLGRPAEPPHPIAKTKLDALYWCAAHESVHAGQIGLLRRQLGRRPLW